MIAIYVRQSIEKANSISIDSQIDFCKKEIIDNEEIKVYEDKGFSGKNIERPAFQSLLVDIKTGLINKVIVYKLDRISRNLLDFAKIIENFNKYKIGFVSCSEKFDTSTAMGNAMLSITMVFAQLERETIQKRVKDNYYARGKKGLYMGGRAPYGFTKIDTQVNGKKTYTFENDVEKIPNLLKMYDLYAYEDISLGKVSDYLNEHNILSAEGKAWDSGKISRLLRSPIFVKADADIYLYYKNKGCTISNDISDFQGLNGCYLYGKRDSNERKYTNIKDHTLSLALHEGVVDSNTWLLCQYKLDSNKQIKNSGKGKHSWLSGYIKCGYCGYAVSVVSARDKRYFSCRGKTNLKICSGYSKTMHVEDIEKHIEKLIFKRADKVKNKKLDEAKTIEDNTIKLQILEIDRQMENLMNQLAESNNIVIKYINEKFTSLENTKNSLMEDMRKTKLVSNNNKSTEEMLNSLDDWY
jgi:site-specific DNA recombinase